MIEIGPRLKELLEIVIPPALIFVFLYLRERLYDDDDD